MHVPQKTFLRTVAAAIILLSPVHGDCQIVLDGTVGPSMSLAGADVVIGDDLGTTVGSNLFHSFSEFNVNTGQSATFSGPASITNIISRVTGASPSIIDGVLGTSISGANMFLANPNGVVFGPNARIDVDGAFAVTSSGYIELGEVGRFDAIDPAQSILTVDNPAAFGFLNGNPGGIVFDRTVIAAGDVGALSIVGGEITAVGASITVPGTRINMIGAGGTGTVDVDVTELFGVVDVSTSIAAAPINLIASVINTDAAGAGGVTMVGGDMVMDQSVISATNTGLFAGIGVDFDTTSLSLLNGSQVVTTSFAVGAGAEIRIAGESLLLSNFSLIATNALFADGGGISINATDVTVAGGSNIATNTFNVGVGGNLEITSDHLLVEDGGAVIANTFGPGGGGSVTVNGGISTLRGSAFFPLTGIVAQSIELPGLAAGGDAGNILIRGELLDISHGAAVSATTVTSGDAGTIRIATDAVTIVGDDTAVFTGIAVQTQRPSGGGAGGGIEIITGDLTTDGRIQISSTTGGNGVGGDIRITADSVVMESGDTAIFSGIDAQTLAPANAGAGGNIHIEATRLALSGGTRVSATTGGAGVGGAVTIAADVIEISGDLAGAVTAIDAQTASSGNGGTVTLDAEQIVLTGNALISVKSRPGASGDGGRLQLTTGTLTVQNEAMLESSSDGSGDAGRIDLFVSGLLQVFDATIAASSLNDGGEIRVVRPVRLHLRRAEITGQAQNNGGNVTLHAATTIVDNSQVRAGAVNGAGGDIAIESEVFFRSPGTVFDASSQFGISGTIDIIAPDIDIAGSLAVLPNTLLTADIALHERCDVKLTDNLSSFIRSGLGGLPAEPGGFLPDSW